MSKRGSNIATSMHINTSVIDIKRNITDFNQMSIEHIEHKKWKHKYRQHSYE
ncbi:hypothetical protein NBRC116592_22410 [Colwellia sp. KU-HH00111]